MIICVIFAIILATFFLIVIILDKTCHTVPVILVANSYLAACVCGSIVLSMLVFTLHNDLKQIQYRDSLCVFRGFMGYTVCFAQNYSYLLQAICRCISVIYPNRLFWQSARFQIFLICLTWILSFLCPIPYVLTGEITYDINNQVCQLPLRLSLLTIYNVICVYLTPVFLTMLIYLILVRYVGAMNKRVTPANILLRARRELKMIRRIVILFMGVATIGFPYTLFVFISFFKDPPKYHFRIAVIFFDISLAFVIIALFQFTEPLRKSIMKRINGRSTMIIPVIA
jgi:hypothetical protein